MEKISLTDAQRGALALLSWAVKASDPGICPLQEIDSCLWQEIKEELKKQSVFPLAAEAMIAEQSGEILTECLKGAGKNMQSFHRILMEQAHVFSFFEQENIPAVVLKGAASAIYYPKPEYRMMGDIDLIVGKNDFDRACRCLIEQGYVLSEKSLLHDRHRGFYGENGIEIEVHHRFSSSTNEKQNAILDGCIYDGILRRERVQLCDHSFDMLPPLENGLVLLAHINQHLFGGLGLRQILDWMLYVRAYLDNEKWETQFRTAADKIGMRILAETVTLMCKQYLGLEDSITWCDSADPKLADELFAYILNKGNFGRRDEINTKKVLIIKHLRNPVSAMRYLTKAGTIHWKAAQKYPFLRPFAWIYQIIYLAVAVRKGKEKITDYFSGISQGREEIDLLKRLKVTRM